MSDDHVNPTRGILLMNAIAVLLSIAGVVVLATFSMVLGVALILLGLLVLGLRLAKYGRVR